MRTRRGHSSVAPFAVEQLESRALLSGTPITFDPAGTLIRSGVGTINGEKFIQVSGSGAGGNVNGIPTGGGHAATHALVFATDFNNNGVVDKDEITGIAISDVARVNIYGDVHGDIVSNLKSNDRLSGDGENGATLLGNNVKSLTVHGSVFGNIITGHGLNKVNIEGTVQDLRIGTAANGLSFQFHGPSGPSVAFADFIRGNNGGGGSIDRVVIGGGVAGIYAGDGGPSGNGGNITSVVIKHDDGGVILRAGNGGDDTLRSGGDGGVVEKIKLISTGGVTILAGNGGNSSDPNAQGGSGGAITSVGAIVTGPISLTSGNGGANTALKAHGGDGGEISGCNLGGSDLTVHAGNGGDGADEAGVGGAVEKFKAVITGVANLTAGNGGNSSAKAGEGGEVKSLRFLAGENALIHAIVAGNGGSGPLGNGNGGSISGVKINGDIGDFNSAFGLSGMGGLFAGLAGTAEGGKGTNGSVSGITALRVASIVAGTSDAPQAAESISGIKAAVIGANFDVSGEAGDGPLFDFYDDIIANGMFDPGERPIDGVVLGNKIGSLGSSPLLEFIVSTHTQIGNVNPH